MAKDIAPELLQGVQAEFKERVQRDHTIARILRRVQKGTATYQDAQIFSKQLGLLLGKSFNIVLKEDVLPDGILYYNILKAVGVPMLADNHRIVNLVAGEIAKAIDAKDGLGLNPIAPALDNERVNGIIDYSTEEGLDAKEAVARLSRNTENLTESYFDEFIQQNADFKYQSGMNPQVIRIYTGSKPCKWCQSLAGTYDYEEVKETGNDVWKRHLDCHCQIIYKNNAGRYMQGAHTKRKMESEQELTAKNILNLDR